MIEGEWKYSLVIGRFSSRVWVSLFQWSIPWILEFSWFFESVAPGSYQNQSFLVLCLEGVRHELLEYNFEYNFQILIQFPEFYKFLLYFRFFNLIHFFWIIFEFPVSNSESRYKFLQFENQAEWRCWKIIQNMYNSRIMYLVKSS